MYLGGARRAAGGLVGAYAEPAGGMDRPRDRERDVPAVGGGRDWDRPRRGLDGLDGLVEAVVSPWKGHVTPPGPERRAFRW